MSDNLEVHTSGRIGFIDLFRAYGIILMIMGHIGFGYSFQHWIHAFHMPMFFFVSGWFYHPYGGDHESFSDYFRHLLNRKIRTLLVPYWLTGVLAWALHFIFIPSDRSFAPLLHLFFYNQEELWIAGAIWFLTALFFAEILYALLDHFISSTWIRSIVCIVLCVLGMMAAQILPFRLPWALDAAFVGIWFYHAAVLIHRKLNPARLTLSNNSIGHPAAGLLMPWPFLLLSFLLTGVLIMACPAVNMREGEYGWYITFLINAMLAIMTGWELAKRMDLLGNNIYLFRLINRWVTFVGRDSIVYLCLNQIILAVFERIIPVSVMPIMLRCFVLLFLTLFVLFFCDRVIMRTGLHRVFGR